MQVELLHIVDANVKWYSCFGIWASSQFLLNLNMYLPYDQAITFLGIYQREMKTNVHKKILWKNIHSSFIHQYQNLLTAQESINRRTDIQIVILFHELNSYCKKETNYWYKQQWFWISKALCWMKEDVKKRYTVWIHLYEILE